MVQLAMLSLFLAGPPCGAATVEDEALPEAWTPHERWIWTQLREGREADLGGPAPDGDGPHLMRDVSTSFLRQILFEEPFKSILRGRTATIRNAFFETAFDLYDQDMACHLALEGCQFRNTVNLTKLRAAGHLAFVKCHFRAEVILRAMHVRGDMTIDRCVFMNELDLTNTRTEGSLVVAFSTFRKGLVGPYMETGSDLVLFRLGPEPGHPTGPDQEEAMNLLGSRLGSFFDPRTTHVNMRGIRVGGHARVTEVQIDEVLDFNSATIRGNLYVLGDKDARIGTLMLREAIVEGSLTVEQMPNLQVLDLDAARIGRTATFSASQAGRFTLRNGAVRGRFRCSDLAVDGALHLSGLSVDSDFICMNSRVPFMDLDSARIGRDASFIASDLHDVSMKNVSVQGRLSFTDISSSPRVHIQGGAVAGDVVCAGSMLGTLDLRFAQVGHLVDVAGATLSYFDLTGAEIQGSLILCSQEGAPVVWRETPPEHAPLVLRYTSIGYLTECPDAWPARMVLDGFTYTGFGSLSPQVVRPLPERGVPWMKDWLDRQEQPSRQAYVQLAGHLEASGYATEAREVLYLARLAERDRATGLKRLWLNLLQVMIGFGYRIYFAFYWITGFVILGAIVFARSKEAKKHGMPFGVAYSLDMLLPIIRLRDLHYAIDLSGKARYYFYLHKMMGYVLASFLIAGLSGLTR